MMLRNICIGVSTLLVVVLGARFLISRTTTVLSPIDQSTLFLATTTTIVITDKAFTPANIKIYVGSSVTFVNTGTRVHWPGSDPHPSHTIYPKFDSKHDLKPGESWTFVFDRVGSWGYHDHDSPLHRGTVQVFATSTPEAELLKKDVEKTKEASTVLKTCDNSSTDFKCYENYYTVLVKQKGVAVAFVDLKEKYNSSSYIQSQCHPLTHTIGHAATLLYPKISDAYTYGDAFCWSGYYHGVMEEIVEKIGVENIAKDLDGICADVPGKSSYSFNYYNCVHGLGHGLMGISKDNLFTSLKMCDDLTGGWEQSSCYGGVFMENVMVDNKNHFSDYLRPTEPLYPCTAVDTPYKPSCYLMQTSYMLKVSGQDFTKVFALCRQADSGYENLCFQSLGRDASGQSISGADATKAKCDLGANYGEKSNCIVGAVKDFVSYYHSDTQAKHLCSTLSEDLRQMCLDTITEYYKSF